jgi:hypothetical protein
VNERRLYLTGFRISSKLLETHILETYNNNNDNNQAF